ncbi:hypothetical protein [Ktedonobacter robiniae]|uniref:Uncharacterized protein n=1 Tax=Ktedonobacter robiniae TaxID=2778365 RepID=A0ABQ3V219_9CHLR|nr:hypothetical protein [Ktedonobacter robiniae]GHO58700.1 hypothetical protein KSB_71750 [Ktedonobacter robiniae]
MSNLPWLASLLKSRNTIDGKIATLIGHAAQVGNVAEYIAATIFHIELDESGKRRGYDGHFTSGPLAGQTVDVQWHPRRDGQMNIKVDALPDYYLVFTGPETITPSFANPWLIDSIFLFHAGELLNALRERGVQLGSGTSVTGPLWERAEIYPIPRNTRLRVSEEERKLLILFS